MPKMISGPPNWYLEPPPKSTLDSNNQFGGPDIYFLDFRNSFILISHKSSAHRFTARYEQFNNEDFDGIEGDNNDDQGDAFTLGYQYDFGGGVFMLLEYNQINSLRPSKVYQRLATTDKETQYQASVRYFF